MDIEIGKKIQLARKEAGLTQEQASEMLSVSRQTISNWENEKSYPDIISVIKMSDLYGISLDILLKGEEKMSNNYLQYLEDSTNVVKSNQKKGENNPDFHLSFDLVVCDDRFLVAYGPERRRRILSHFYLGTYSNADICGITSDRNKRLLGQAGVVRGSRYGTRAYADGVFYV